MANGSIFNLPSLLILPPHPSPTNSRALKAAYGPSVAAALSELSSLKSSGRTILEILLPFSSASKHPQEPRSHVFNAAQHLLASVYSLIYSVSAQNAIELDGDAGIDCRIILLAYDNSPNPPSVDPLYSGAGAGFPIVELATFALARRKWRFMFSVNGERGKGLFREYIGLANRTFPLLEGEVREVAGGISLIAADSEPLASKNKDTYTVVAVGGTFDHLHAGHKLLLTATALLLQPSFGTGGMRARIIVGITGDELLKSKRYADYLLSWTKRQEDVVDFLSTIISFCPPGQREVETMSIDEPVVNGRAIHTTFKNEAVTIECVEIQDPFGPTITDESISALVVSGETRSGGLAVNTKREEKGWKSLDVFEVDVLDAVDEEESTAVTENFAAKISSTAIRKLISDKAIK